VSRPLSIALLSHMASADSPTGAERSLATLASGLARRGHRVLVVAPERWTLSAELQAAGADVHVQPCRVLWLTSHDGPSPARVAAQWLRFWLPPSGERGLARSLAERRPDVVHVNCLPHVHGARAARRAGVPVVWHVREILPPGARRRWFAARLGETAREIVAVSEAVGAWIRDEGLGSRLSVVHNGVAEHVSGPPARDEARSHLGLPLDGCVVGLYGQILPHKGVLEFVRAGRRALRIAPELRFVIAGRGPRPFVDRVRREIESGDGRERFHLLPPQRASERLLAASDVACLTTTAPDPLPRSVLEAMAAGLPVVTFRSGGAPEMVLDGETGFVVEVGDEIGLAEGVARLARDADLRRALGEAGRARARERFSLEGHLRRMEEVLEQAAAP
jgi:glycosyltransferase involved in cell wall biosynthesis